MFDCRDAFPAAVVHHQSGRLDEAAALYRRILDVEADNAAALNNLGMIVTLDEAVPLFKRAIAVRPDYCDALTNLAESLWRRGERDDALACFGRAARVVPHRADLFARIGTLLHGENTLDAAMEQYGRALAVQPDHVAALCGTASIHYSRGQLEDAALFYERALAVEPDIVEALANLGTIHATGGRWEEAAGLYRRALRLDPDLAAPNLNMVTILAVSGRIAEALTFRDRLARPHDLIVETAPAPRRTVLVLSSYGSGNVPIEMILPRHTTTRITWYIDCATDAQEAALPDYDVAFNAIGNADLTEHSFAATQRFHERRPVLNAPASIERTRRDRMPALMAGLDGVLTPPVARLGRDEMLDAALGSRLAALGIACPVIVRPITTQGGQGVILAETADAFRDMPLSEADAFYCIGYHDYRSADGFYRKYRVMFIDRTPYPYHLAISKHWLVHYFSADMMDGAWKRAEERRFLDDPAAALGRAGWAAIEAIGRRMDLDYAGIDFSLLPDGRILVFEANATMSLHLVESVEDFPYKHVHVPAIARAFDDMLTRRSGTAPAIDQAHGGHRHDDDGERHGRQRVQLRGGAETQAREHDHG